MPTYMGEPEHLEQIKKEEEQEREFYAAQQERREAHELKVIQEKGKVASERLRMTHRADSRASIWITLFSIIPKTTLIIVTFILMLFKRQVPKEWIDYSSR